jgi:hypothetical protein
MVGVSAEIGTEHSCTTTSLPTNNNQAVVNRTQLHSRKYTQKSLHGAESVLRNRELATFYSISRLFGVFTKNPAVGPSPDNELLKSSSRPYTRLLKAPL